MTNKTLNTLNFIFNESRFWTVSPCSFSPSDSAAQGFYINSNGSINFNWIINDFGVRPVINLKSDVEITGGIGTINNPYVIKTN